MNRIHIDRTAYFALVTLLALGALACGGGGGGGVTPLPGPLTATFTPSNSNPGAMTISMDGSASGANFSVRVNVTDIPDFFGTGFRVTFNPASAQFAGFTSTGSVLEGQPATDFQAQLQGGNEVWVDATLVGQVQGVNVVGTQLLLTLNFRATAATANNPFGFDTAATRVVETCPAPPAGCSDVPEAQLTWSGGSLSATN